MKLKIASKKDFIANILGPISNLNDKVVLKVEKDKISSLTASTDATLVLYSETESECEGDKSINIPDIKKLVRVLECVEGDALELDVNSNNIKYAGDNFKFTFHLLEEGIIKVPSINVKKINDLKFDTTFKVNEQKLSSLFKGASFTTETNKLYVFFENNKVYGELGDKSRHNSDNFQCVLSDEFTGTALTKTLPINFETFRLINFNKCQNIEFAVNLTLGVLKIVLLRDKTKLTYIVSALIN
jgi:hypothetical protein